MAKPYLPALVLLIVVVGPVYAIPSSYVLKVDHDCGATIADVTVVRVLTDLSIRLDVQCKGGTMVVGSTDTVNYEFEAKYEGNSSDDCLFKQRKNSKIWVLLLNVLWSEPRDTIRSKREQFLVTCTLDPHAMNHTDPHHTKDGLLGAVELQGRMGDDSSSTISLKIIDIEGNALRAHVAIGRKVRLKATMTPAAAERGFRSVSCNAIGGNNSYAVLRGGCGDGIVFPRGMGFTTTGTSILSPYFAAFKLRDQEYLSFDCNFTTCMENCDGDSCTNEPNKRDTEIHQVVRRDVISSSSGSLMILMKDHNYGLLSSDPPAHEVVKLKADEAGEPEVYHEQGHIAKGLDQSNIDGQVDIIQPETVEDDFVEPEEDINIVIGMNEMDSGVTSDSCQMTDTGFVCKTVLNGVVKIENRMQTSNVYEILAVILLLVQTCATVAIVVGLIIANSRTSNSLNSNA